MSRIAILTDLNELHDGYSLTHVIRNQLAMLSRYGHETTLFVSEDFEGSLSNCSVEKCIPVYEKIQYKLQMQITQDHVQYAYGLRGLLVEKLKGFDVVFTHDWIFKSFMLPLAEGLRRLAPETRNLKFFHWIHSLPASRRDWWNISRYGLNHKIVYPNVTHTPQVADLFRGDTSDVIAVPHIVDMRTLFDFSQEIRDFIDEYPGLLQSTFVQVYPAAGDRLEDKGLRNLILLFKTLKAHDSVFLLVVDSLSGERPREDLSRYQKLAHSNGLSPEEFAFTSEFQSPKYDRGVPRKILMELMQCSNLFIFPTKGESFGLCFTEASLAGGVLPVLNESLSPMKEVGGDCGLYVPFGSCEKGSTPPNEREHFERMADAIYWTSMNDESWKSRTFMRKTYNMDAIYTKYYKPLMSNPKVITGVSMPDLSVIIPFVGEYPHILFTIQTIHDDLKSKDINFEIVVVDNFCDEAVRHGTRQHSDPRKTAYYHIQKLIDEGSVPWLRLLSFTERLSHWGAKNLAVRSTESPYLLFLDSHVVPEPGTLSTMFNYYQTNERDLNGTLHLPISNLLKSDARVYQLVHNAETGLLHYKFIPLTTELQGLGIFQAPCMSSCGMMTTRKIITDDIEYWPEELGPYGGGENYINFALGLMGKNAHVLTLNVLRHFAEHNKVWARDYVISNAEWLRNRLIATYLIGGEQWAVRFAEHLKMVLSGGQKSPATKALDVNLREILASQSLKTRRDMIKSKTVVSIDEFIAKWERSPLCQLNLEGFVR